MPTVAVVAMWDLVPTRAVVALWVLPVLPVERGLVLLPAIRALGVVWWSVVGHDSVGSQLSLARHTIFALREVRQQSE